MSGALMDALVAGLAAVASRTLVEALEPSDTVLSVPDHASAEMVSAAIDQALGIDRDIALEARGVVIRERDMDRYAARLIEAALE